MSFYDRSTTSVDVLSVSLLCEKYGGALEHYCCILVHCEGALPITNGNGALQGLLLRELR